MADGVSSGLASGTSGSPQTNLENNELQNKSKENEAILNVYNSADSSNVREVTSILQLYDAHSMPISYYANSVVQNIMNGKVVTERYYGSDGKPYLDIDYSDHGNPKMHPIVPHEHFIEIVNGKIKREKVGRGIK